MLAILNRLKEKKEKILKKLEEVDIDKMKNLYSEMNYLWSLITTINDKEIIEVIRENFEGINEEDNRKLLLKFVEGIPLFKKMKRIDEVLSEHHRIKNLDKSIKIVKRFIDLYNELN